VIGAAKRVDAQVFATTHSRDCIGALATLYERDPSIEADVSLHRLDRGAQKTTVYSAKELAIAARQHVEVR
jgi:hypothetical protein